MSVIYWNDADKLNHFLWKYRTEAWNFSKTLPWNNDPADVIPKGFKQRVVLLKAVDGMKLVIQRQRPEGLHEECHINKRSIQSGFEFINMLLGCVCNESSIIAVTIYIPNEVMDYDDVHVYDPELTTVNSNTLDDILRLQPLGSGEEDEGVSRIVFHTMIAPVNSVDEFLAESSTVWRARATDEQLQWYKTTVLPHAKALLTVIPNKVTNENRSALMTYWNKMTEKVLFHTIWYGYKNSRYLVDLKYRLRLESWYERWAQLRDVLEKHGTVKEKETYSPSTAVLRTQVTEIPSEIQPSWINWNAVEAELASLNVSPGTVPLMETLKVLPDIFRSEVVLVYQEKKYSFYPLYRNKEDAAAVLYVKDTAETKKAVATATTTSASTLPKPPTKRKKMANPQPVAVVVPPTPPNTPEPIVVVVETVNE